MTRDEILTMPTGPEMDGIVAERIMGWRWWAHTKEERDEPHGPRISRVVRTLHSPTFDRRQWDEWAKLSGKVFRPAAGTEPVERVQCMGDAVRISQLPPYSTDIAAAWEVHKTACERLFSERRRYLDCLTEVVRTRVKASVAWPDVLVFIEPADFCRAAMLAGVAEPAAAV